MQTRIDPLEDLVGDLFVDRDAELNRFWRWAMSMPSPLPHDSHALIGRRRTGKTALMVKLFNRLYHEQRRVLPVFVSFAEYLKRPEPQISWSEFAAEYFIGYLRSYLAFRHREPTLLNGLPDWDLIRAFVAQVQDPFASELLTKYDRLTTSSLDSVKALAGWAISLPSVQARVHNMPTVILIDEFQVLATAYNEERQIQWGITSLFQNAVETHWAPVLVSGSAVSTLVHEALAGALSGRFSYHFIEPLPHEHAYDLVFRLGERYGVSVTEELAEAIWQISGGYPYSIEALMTSEAPAIQHYPDLAALAEVVAFEISDNRGKLYQHNFTEFEKYSHLLNSGQLTKKVMFWATKYPDQMIDEVQIATELGESLENVQASLKKLRQVDVIQPVTWSRYNGPSDPMLRRYIEYNHHREIENLAPAEALKDWQQEYASLQGRLNRYAGETGEVYVQGVMNCFDDRTVDGSPYFHCPAPVRLPKFTEIERRGGIVQGGTPIEIDLVGEWLEAEIASPSYWLVQVKNQQTPISDKDVTKFLRQCEQWSKKHPHRTLVRWYYAKSGFTSKARQLLEQAGVLSSDRQAFNQLARLFDFFGFPEA
ncbi:MAG: ATP-binding protein [Caldilineaceae bacterium]